MTLFSYKKLHITILTGISLFMISACGGEGGSNLTPDKVAPVIKLQGLTDVQIFENANYIDAGVKATDNRDGDISANVLVAGDAVDTASAPGTTFTLTYNVSDAAGNRAIQVIRTVSIIKDNGKHDIPELSAADKEIFLSTINDARSVARTCPGREAEGGHPARAKEDFPKTSAVTWNDKLYKAAFEHSQDMANADIFAHDGSGTSTDWSGFILGRKSKARDRVASYDYKWSRLSENLSVGTSRDTAQKAVDSWIASPGHCHNLMDAGVTEVGMALFIREDSTYKHYWSQNFGMPR